MRSVDALKKHPHTTFVDIYSEKHLNEVIARSYRECVRKMVRLDAMMPYAGEQCSFCLHRKWPFPACSG